MDNVEVRKKVGSYIIKPGVGEFCIPILGGGYYKAVEDKALPMEPFEKGWVRKQVCTVSVEGGAPYDFEVWWLQEAGCVYGPVYAGRQIVGDGNMAAFSSGGYLCGLVGAS